MIIIDGRQSAAQIGNFTNLEDLLVKVVEEEVAFDHVVTDILVNKEAFSEIYPHHAEDIETDEIRSVEVRTISLTDLAAEMTKELYVVIKIMQDGSRKVAGFLRQGDVSEGLEVLQDLLDVTRNFIGTISALHQRFPLDSDSGLIRSSSHFDELLAEMCDVMSEQDWLLLADLLEYEFIPACEEWEQIVGDIASDAAATRVE